eukprot:c25075_g1_i1 orf=610-1206(+)
MPRFRQPAKRGQVREEPIWLKACFRAVNFLPGLILGFLLGLWVELPKKGPADNTRHTGKNVISDSSKRRVGQASSISGNIGEELKMVFVVRQDLKMGGGKVASQCAHAAVGIYSELMKSQRSLLQRWEQYGQPKIVVTCKNLQEMNNLRAKAEMAGIPTFIVADAGKTQVAAGSKTVLAIGPGAKSSIDSITHHLRLL